MKRNISLFSIFLMGIIILSSCSDKDVLDDTNKVITDPIKLTQHEYVSLYENEINDLQENDIVNLVSSFIDEVQDQQQGLKSTISNRKISIIKQIKTRSIVDQIKIRSTSEDNNDLFYHVAVEENGNKGFSIVSANKLFPEVIAYIPKGNLSDTIEIEGMKIMYDLVIANAKEKLKEYQSDKDSLKSVAIGKISNELDLKSDDIIDNLKSIHVEVVGDPEKQQQLKASGMYVSVPWGLQRFPILKTQWGQEYPYNGLHPISSCPSHNNSVYRNRYYAGCVITACAQLAAVGKYKNQERGTLAATVHVPADPTNAQELALHNEVMNLTNEIRQLIKVSYDCDGTAASTSQAVGILGRYNLAGKSIDPTNATLGNYDLVWARAESSKSGGAHSFIIDGHCLYYMGGRDDAVFINLGWNGSGNGWYIVRSFGTNIGYDTNFQFWSIRRTD